MKTETEHDYQLHAAGRLWSVGPVELTHLPDGTVAIAEAEIRRVHRAIANALCARTGTMSGDELEFLCGVTRTSFTDVASRLGVNKSTITIWRRRGHVPRATVSNVLRRWFWFRLFGDEIGSRTVQLQVAGDDTLFLDFATRAAIDDDATFAVQERMAS